MMILTHHQITGNVFVCQIVVVIAITSIAHESAVIRRIRSTGINDYTHHSIGIVHSMSKNMNEPAVHV